MDRINMMNDYLQGCHPEILKKLSDTNMEATVGYGLDQYCASAIDKIRKACGREDIDVHFIVGGTQTNLISIAHILRPHQAAVSTVEGHIATHESGAVEGTGHKVITLPSHDGKLSAEEVDELFSAHFGSEISEHMPQPALVYISQPTEIGTLYTKKELSDLHEVCRKFDVPLYADGARLGYALGSESNDVTLKDMAELTDIFYIGGTKCGAMFGEALVITDDRFKKDFRYIYKQRGAMLAKGRLLGIQFDVLFTDDLYTRICQNAVSIASRIKNALKEKGIELYGNSTTNQLFFKMDGDLKTRIEERFILQFWDRDTDGRSVYRLCTSWATTEEQADLFISLL